MFAEALAPHRMKGAAVGRADLKEVKARKREINNSMKSARDSLGSTPQEQILQIPGVLAEVVGGLAIMSTMVERLTDHLLDETD
jgi:hypothetical protein